MLQPRQAIDYFLRPGEYFVGNADYRILTLLGSCVSISLWHAGKRIGAMSHFLLSHRNSSKASAPDARYGEEALWLMLQQLRRAGVEPAACEGKIFGGGNMFPGHVRDMTQNVGKRNGEAARELLQAHRIPIVSESLFGVGHRQIVFDISTGHVWARQVKPVEAGSPETWRDTKAFP